MKRLSICTFLLCAVAMLWAQPQNDSQKHLRKLIDAERIIANFYVDKVDEEKLVVDAIKGMLQKLDPHSEYLTTEEVKQLNEPLQGNFDGIGVQFQMFNDTLLIIQTIAGGPSEKVGLLAGDRIITVNDTTIAGVKMVNTDIMKRLRGKKGTQVRVGILRRGNSEIKEYKIIRDKIPIHSLDAAYLAEEGVGYVRLNRFAATSYQEVKDAIKKLQNQGMTSLIFDLQGNGGGYLNAAVQIANEFLDTNQMIVYTEGSNQRRSEEKATTGGTFKSGKLVILIDESSASASEILAGAIQDWDRGTIIGRRSFGKGLVQRPLMMNDGSMIKLTTARYYTPSGRFIQKPYEDGRDNYAKDLVERYNRGELLHADSIHFPDSLKYQTLIKKRTVYGGGGIMPDLFVPVDTTKFTNFHREVIAKGVVNKIIVSYNEKNRISLKKRYKTEMEFIKKFTFEEPFYQELIHEAEKEKITIAVADTEKSKELLLTQMKALVGRDMYEDGTYLRIMNQYNEVYLKALEYIKE